MTQICLPLVLLMLGFSLSAARGDVVPTALVPTTKVYSSGVLAGMSTGELVQMDDEFRQLKKSVHEILRRENNDGIRYETVRQVGRYHTLEAQRLIFEVIRSELARVDNSTMGADPRLLTETLRTLASFGSFGNTRPSDLALEFNDIIEEATGRLRSHIYKTILIVELNEAKATIDARRERLTDVAKLLEGRNGTGRFAPREKLDFARKYLKSHVIGQDYVTDRILAKIWSSLVDGGVEERPNVFVLMGPKGSGHGTIARGLVRALNGYPTADKVHLFEMPVLKDHDDLWTSMGSAVGYYGSESGVPRLVQWLVDHSGGRYDIQREKGERGGSKFRVVQNPEWSPSAVASGTSPRDAVLFIKDFQNWSKAMKDQFLLPALTDGYFKLNNPNDGEEQMYVPVNIVIETTDGTSLLTSKEINGQRQGKPLTFEQMHVRSLEKREDRVALEAVFHEGNDLRTRMGGQKAPGNSEALVATLMKSGPLLLAPQNDANLVAIAEQHLTAFAHRLHGGTSGPLGRATLTWTPDLARFVANYGVLAEDGALGLPERIDDLVRAPLAKLVELDEIRLIGNSSEIELGLTKNEDRTHSLHVRFRSEKGEWSERDSLMLTTQKDRPRPPISDARIDELVDLAPRMKRKVFGIDPIVERLADRALTIANSGDKAFPANVILMDGLSSTGKTQTAKEFAAELLGDADDLVTFDFSRIQTQRVFEEEISGLRDADGNAIKSKFMKAYDRANGRLVIAFDELANVRDPNLLKILYDILREATVYTFSDGKPRPMTGVTIIITGNATEGLYTRVPAHLPMEVQMRAFEQISERVGIDFSIQRGELGKTYPEAFMNRVQRGNTFIMAPHNYKTLRQLTQLKLELALDHLRTTGTRRGWDIVFADKEDYSSLVTSVIEEGFELREQGASIEKYVDNEFRVSLETLLLRRKVPSGTRVVLKRAGETANDDPLLMGQVQYDVYADGVEDVLRLNLPRPYRKKPLKTDPHILMKTAFHEAGHSLVSLVTTPNAFVPVSLSVIEGLTVINNEFVHYAGIWDSEQQIDLSITRDFVVREIAVLLGGYTAERMVMRGQAHASGKANDIERVATLAQAAILRFGLSKRWGIDAIPKDETIEQFVGKLPDWDKKLLRKEGRLLVAEGQKLAEDIIEANFKSVFVPLGLKLAEAGQLEGKEIQEFYDEHPPLDPRTRGVLRRAQDRNLTWWRRFKNPSLGTLSPEVIGEITRPEKIANVNDISRKRKQALYDQVPLPENLPTGTNERFEKSRGPRLLPAPKTDCETLLAPAA